jgi:hypothetical protein
MLTEDALRQIVGANIPGLEEAEQALEQLFRMLQNQEMDQDNDLLDVIARSMEDPTNNKPPPASEADLRKLRTSLWNSSCRKDDCGICLSSYSEVAHTYPLYIWFLHGFNIYFVAGGGVDVLAMRTLYALRVPLHLAEADGHMPLLQAQSSTPTARLIT